MPIPKNKFKIGRKNSQKKFSKLESKNSNPKKVSSASYQASKKHEKVSKNFSNHHNASDLQHKNKLEAANAPGGAKTIVPAMRLFGKKAPYSKTKKIYPPHKTSNADIIVKRSTYSKAVRAAILADAAARQRLIEIGGENTINIIREFDTDMSDDELAKKIGIKPSEVRVVLNRLHNRGVFTYTRVRDKDSGWYSYIWKLDEGRLKDVGGVAAEETTQAMGNEGYRCACCTQQKIIEFSEAVDARFRCGRCGSCLEFFDSRQNRVEKP